MIVDPICNECGGACCDEERLEFPVAADTTMETAAQALSWLGLPDAIPLEVRRNEHGRTVIRTLCPRRGHCDQSNRPLACLVFPLSYVSNHTEAERAEVREFCALFRRLKAEGIQE